MNHSLGRVTADCLLVAIARRLQSSLRATDAVAHQPGSTLARLGGDEFTVLLEDITDASDAIRVADRLDRRLAKPFDVEGHQVFVSATVGITVSTTGYVRTGGRSAGRRHRAPSREGQRHDGLRALRSGDAGARGLAPAGGNRPAERDRQREFAVVYQPIIALETGKISGFEALVRWRHPTRGLLSPAEFIPVAEDTGMIGQIGRLVLIESCRQMVDWQRRFGPDAPQVICVNVSGRQLAHVDLASDIEAILRDTGLAASSLKLEITESAYISDVRRRRRR